MKRRKYVGLDNCDRAVQEPIRRERDRFGQALADGTAAFAYGGTFWCIWGFKP